jgi:hypothetical protein
MTTPLEQADLIITEVEGIFADPTLNAAQRAGSLLPYVPRLLNATKDLREFHLGYSLEHRRISALVSKLLRTMLDASTGELKWVADLPPGKAPEFRRALTDLQTHFKQTPV